MTRAAPKAEQFATPFRVLFVYYAARCFLAALMAFPFALALSSPGLAKHPEGDAILFAPGGIYLLETLRLGRDALDAATSAVPWYFLVACVLGLIPTGLLLFGLAHSRAPLSWLVTQAVDVFPRFVLLSAAALIAQALTVAVLVFVAFQAQTVFSATFTPERGDLAFGAVVLLGAPFFLLLSLLFDLARAGVVLYGFGFAECIAVAKSTLAKRSLRVLIAWCRPALGASILVVAAGFVVGKLRIEAGDTWRWIAALVIHQVVIAALCAAEARWLRKALGFVAAHKALETESSSELTVHGQVAVGGAVPAQIEPHDATP